MYIFAILTVVVVIQMLGFLWYAPFFGEAWFAAQGKTMADVDMSNPAPMIFAVFGALAMAVAMYILIKKLGLKSPVAGGALGALLWLGFIFPIIGTHYLFLQFSPLLIAIDAGKELIAMILAGAILAGWKRS